MRMFDPVSKIMTRDVISIKEHDSLREFKEIFRRRKLHHLLVENLDGELTGIISESDILRNGIFLFEDDIIARNIMTKDPDFIHENHSIKEVIEIFLQNVYRAMPVKNSIGTLVGIVTPYDVMNALHNEKLNQNENA